MYPSPPPANVGLAAIEKASRMVRRPRFRTLVRPLAWLCAGSLPGGRDQVVFARVLDDVVQVLIVLVRGVDALVGEEFAADLDGRAGLPGVSAVRRSGGEVVEYVRHPTGAGFEEAPA